MSFKLLVMTSLSLLATQAEAALPPLWASAREIQGLLADSQLGQYLQAGDIIQKIERTADGFDVITDRAALHVAIRVKTPLSAVVGPSEYEYHFSRLQK